MYSGVFGTADPNAGGSLLLPAFAAVFLGATAVEPGRFNALGTLISIYLVSTGIVGLTFLTGSSAWVPFVFNGTVLILALAAQRLVMRIRARRQG
jgi:ribose transport system permease protein